MGGPTHRTSVDGPSLLPGVQATGALPARQGDGARPRESPTAATTSFRTSLRSESLIENPLAFAEREVCVGVLAEEAFSAESQDCLWALVAGTATVRTTGSHAYDFSVIQVPEGFALMATAANGTWFVAVGAESALKGTSWVIARATSYATLGLLARPELNSAGIQAMDRLQRGYEREEANEKIGGHSFGRNPASVQVKVFTYEQDAVVAALVDILNNPANTVT